MGMAGGAAGTTASLVDGLDHQPPGAADATLGVCGHDRVIPIIIEGGGLSTQRTGPIWIPLNGIVITLWRDLLPIFEPIDL